MANRNGRSIARTLLRASCLVGLPLLLLPALLPRKIHAKRLSRAPVSTGTSLRATVLTLGDRVQRMVDELKARLEIESSVRVSIVPDNALLFSVRRFGSGEDAFSLSVDQAFADGLSDNELRGIVAHELGHVWIFTHHPFLQTEELANQIALRVVARDVLNGVYTKVWQRTGSKGALVYLPVDE